MTVVTLDDIPPAARGVTGPRPTDRHIDAHRVVHAAKTLLGRVLRMLLVVSCFAAAAAAVMAVRLYAFMPALHH